MLARVPAGNLLSITSIFSVANLIGTKLENENNG